MKNKAIFTEVHAPHTGYFIDGFDSAVNSGECSVGFVSGQYGKMNAVVSEHATEQDHWHVVNLTGQINGKSAFDSCAVLGASNADEAETLAVRYFGKMFDSADVESITSSHQGLERYLNLRNFANKPQVALWQLEKQQDVSATIKPMWDSAQLISHQAQLSTLLLDMQRNDDHDALVEPFDSLASYMDTMPDAVFEQYDAIIVDYQYLDKMMMMLHKAMKTASKTGVKVINVETSKPFKRKNVAQVAVVYTMDDGQSFTTLLHNPDATPAKLANTDTLISWKYMLNKRDVTGIVQPNQGETIALPILASRIMQLVNKNSARFKRRQTQNAEKAQALADAQARIEEKQGTVSALDAEIDALQNQLDGLVGAKKDGEPKPNTSRVVAPTQVEIEDLPSYGEVEITDVGEENIYFTKNGKEYYSKVGDTEKYEIGSYDFNVNQLEENAYTGGSINSISDALDRYGRSDEIDIDKVEAFLSKKQSFGDTSTGIEHNFAFDYKKGLSSIFYLLSLSNVGKMYNEIRLNTRNQSIVGLKEVGNVLPFNIKVYINDYISKGGQATGLEIVPRKGHVLFKFYINTKSKNMTPISVLNVADFTKALSDNEQSEVTPVNDAGLEQKENVNTHPSYSQEDIEYLNSIIDGTIAPLDADMDRLIEIGEKDDTDELFTKALDIVSVALDEASA